jgi:hypothetical protein
MSAPDPFALGGEPDDDKAFAALEFEPIDNADLIADLTQPAYGKMWFGLGVPLRLAATIVGMTKPELIEVTGKILAEEADDGDPAFERHE